ncbi:MAG: hypothetical protein K6F63_02240, partial [Lachnospiraceae bacterium]|nr:hypothetical protein [Lachnospiraceae bacterium]
MGNKKLKYIWILVAVSLLLSSLSTVKAAGDVNEDKYWDKQFSGQTSGQITFRSYIHFEVYDDDTGSLLGL